MKIGLLADIHGNIYAFEKVWKQLRHEFCDLYFFLGDVCGYYYHQNEIIEILRSSKDIVSILGNHDALFLNMQKDKKLEKDYARKYGNSCIVLKKSITEENHAFLKGLPKKFVLKKESVALFHGSPWETLNDYVYPTDSLERFKQFPQRVVILGHTHYAMDRFSGKVRVINPGSSGQPRDCNEPSYTVFDTKTGEAEFKRVKYDIKPLIKDIRKNKESNPYLWKVLRRKGIN